MTWKPLQLRGIAYISPSKEPALLEFQRGLNVICGASDTGKSFILETIDFLLGGKPPIRDIPERIGYDRVKLVLETNEQEFTLERSTSGGKFKLFEGSWLTNTPDNDFLILGEKHDFNKKDTLSAYLLSAIDLTGKFVQKNQEGETNSLSFRNLIKLILVNESDITKQISPILSVQRTSKTVDYSVFKLLLTGIDDSALIKERERQNEIISSKQTNKVKIELIDELIEELQTGLREPDVNREGVEAQLSQIEANSEIQQAVLTRLRQNLNDRIERRSSIIKQTEEFSNRIDEIAGLRARFELLRNHYQVDLNRLAAIQESGSLFIHLEIKPCPLCGASPDKQHQTENCDGDIASVVHAANAEIGKIEKLRAELDKTLMELATEADELIKTRQQLVPEYQYLNQEIEECLSPLEFAQSTFNQLLKQASEAQSILDKLNRIKQLQEKREMLLAEADADDEIPTSSSYVDLSRFILDEFAQKVRELLEAWNFPGSDRVYFDESSKDIVINGQPRASRGKGLRAITHAAMTIGLMEFCEEKNLPHPGFVILDSPLLAYYKPESSEDSLKETDLENRFYTYLIEKHSDNQIIIIENDIPPIHLRERIALNIFTKNCDEGRYGFFPLVK